MVIIFLILSKNPSLHHPRATFLGLTNEKIVLLSANSIRATVATENNKVWNTLHWLINISRLNPRFSSFLCPISIFSFFVFLTSSTNTKCLSLSRVIQYIVFLLLVYLYYNPALEVAFCFKGRKKYSDKCWKKDIEMHCSLRLHYGLKKYGLLYLRFSVWL